MTCWASTPAWRSRAATCRGPRPSTARCPSSSSARTRSPRELRKMLRVRAQYRINESEQVELPAVQARGLVVMVHRLPGGAGTQVTAVNFGRAAVREARDAQDGAAGRVGRRPPRGEGARQAGPGRAAAARARSARGAGPAHQVVPRRIGDDRRGPATTPELLADLEHELRLPGHPVRLGAADGQHERDLRVPRRRRAPDPHPVARRPADRAARAAHHRPHERPHLEPPGPAPPLLPRRARCSPPSR